MVYNQFPDPDLNSGYFYNDLWSRNILLKAKSKSITYIDKKGPLSVKTTLKGTETYVLDNIPIRVYPESILIINENHSYTSIIDSKDEVDSASLYFRKDLEKEVFAGLTQKDDLLLSNPYYSRNSVEFFEFKQQKSKRLVYLLNQLLGMLPKSENLLLKNEINIYIIEELLCLNYQLYVQANKLNHQKTSTRLEIFKRINQTKEYIQSSYAKDLNLTILASIACMSEYHFLRSFKSVVGKTPHQYLIQLRINSASELLKKKTYALSEICDLVGFKDIKYLQKLIRTKMISD